MNPQSNHWPSRTMTVKGNGITTARCAWEQKHGIWFCIRADRHIGFMSNQNGCFTLGRLPQLKRMGLTYEWEGDLPEPKNAP